MTHISRESWAAAQAKILDGGSKMVHEHESGIELGCCPCEDDDRQMADLGLEEECMRQDYEKALKIARAAMGKLTIEEAAAVGFLIGWNR
jgi:hypothetical protein